MAFPFLCFIHVIEDTSKHGWVEGCILGSEEGRGGEEVGEGGGGGVGERGRGEEGREGERKGKGREE